MKQEKREDYVMQSAISRDGQLAMERYKAYVRTTMSVATDSDEDSDEV